MPLHPFATFDQIAALPILGGLHRLGGLDLVVRASRCGFDVDDHRVLDVDQVIEPVACSDQAEIPSGEVRYTLKRGNQGAIEHGTVAVGIVP